MFFSRVLFLSYAFGDGPSWMLSIRTCWMPTRPFDLVRRQIPRLVLEDHAEPRIKVLSSCPLGVWGRKERTRSHVIGLVLLITLRPAKTALQLVVKERGDSFHISIRKSWHHWRPWAIRFWAWAQFRNFLSSKSYCSFWNSVICIWHTLPRGSYPLWGDFSSIKKGIDKTSAVHADYSSYLSLPFASDWTSLSLKAISMSVVLLIFLARVIFKWSRKRFSCRHRRYTCAKPILFLWLLNCDIWPLCYDTRPFWLQQLPWLQEVSLDLPVVPHH